MLFNYSHSLPLGIYRVSSAPPLRGSLVAVCLPSGLARYAAGRGYTGAGICPTRTAPLLKIVAGLAGDLVVTRSDAVDINGASLPYSRRQPTDLRGRPHDLPPFSGRLPPESVWVHAPHPRSWDSRYFGPIPRASIRTTLTPLLVWSAP